MMLPPHLLYSNNNNDLLTNFFPVQPILCSYMISWKRHVNDTIVYVKIDAIKHVISIFNLFHGNA